MFVYCTLHSCLVSQYLLQSLNSLTNYRQYLQAICLTEASQERENWTCIRSTTRQQKTCPPQTLPCPNPCPRYWKCTLTCMSVLWIITTWTRLFIQKNKWPPTIDYRLIIETDTSWHLTRDMFQVELKHSGNVTAVLERGALLNCRVRGIGNRTVSQRNSQ